MTMCIDQVHERTVIIAGLVVIGLSLQLIVAFSFIPYAKVLPEVEVELVGGDGKGRRTTEG